MQMSITEIFGMGVYARDNDHGHHRGHGHGHGHHHGHGHRHGKCWYRY